MSSPEELLRHDQTVVRTQMWNNRSEILDYLLVHTCDLAQLHRSFLRLSGVDPEVWIQAALLQDWSIVTAWEKQHGF